MSFIVIIVLLLGAYAVMVIRPKWQRSTPLQRALNIFDNTTKQLGLQRERDETIAAFCFRLAEPQPGLSAPCKQLAKVSERALYADDKRCKAELIRALRRFPR